MSWNKAGRRISLTRRGLEGGSGVHLAQVVTMPEADFSIGDAGATPLGYGKHRFTPANFF
jgi:hypothetical protein